jgi:hypothetical protein
MKIKNGSRHEENGWIRISITGTPYARGKAHGYLVAPELKKIMRMLDFNLMNTYGFDRFVLREIISELYGTNIKNRYPEYYEEMKGIVEGAKIRGTILTLDDIILWNCYYSLEYLMDHAPGLIHNNPILHEKYGTLFPIIGKKQTSTGEGGGGGKDKCTAFMAVGDYTKDGNIVCGHNTFDNFIDAQHGNVILDIKPEKGNSIIMQTSPGCIASGTDFYVTSNGFICTETTLGGFQVFELKDPICCRIRKAMQYAKTLDECDQFLSDGNGGDYANSWFIGDTKTNTIMYIELGLKYKKVERTTNGYYIGYNAPTDPRIRNLECSNTGYNDIRRHQGARRVRLTQLIEEHKGKLDVEVGEKILADHYDVYLNKVNPCSRTCCSHYELDDRAFMSQVGRPVPYQPRGAIDGIVCDTTLAKKMGLAARWGTSCGTPFFAKPFLERNIQWSELTPYLLDRVSQPWTIFGTNTKKDSRKNAIRANTNNYTRKNK